MKRLKVIPERCTGCESCVLSCSFVHEGFFNLDFSRVLVDRDTEHAQFTPRVCVQCAEHPCVEVCPVGALSVEPTTGAIQLAEERGLPLICDLCGGDPECVKACQMPKALEFVEY